MLGILYLVDLNYLCTCTATVLDDIKFC